ncbi:MAG TPA: hypothetical protein ENF93_00860 [Ignisphaera sp.]|nr:hypothetical protein [Ignisphaera sp.]
MKTVLAFLKKLWVKWLFDKASHHLCTSFNWRKPPVLIWQDSVTWNIDVNELYLSFLYTLEDRKVEVAISDYNTGRHIVKHIRLKDFKPKKFAKELEMELLGFLLSEGEYDIKDKTI